MTRDKYGDLKLERSDIKRVGALVLGLVLLVVTLVSIGSLVEDVAADEIVVIQYPTGTLKVVSDPGPTFQGFGNVTTYRKRSEYKFEHKIKFNDKGGGTLKGSIQYELPTDEQRMLNIHQKFKSQNAVQAQIIEPVVNKCIYLTGPLMSSEESAAEKRNDLIRYIEDQVQNGVYRVAQKEVSITDQLDESKTRTKVVAEIATAANGTLARQERSIVGEYGIKPFNFSITDLEYDPEVKAQIAGQQKLTMEVQTSIAEARKAEQRAYTVEQEGKARAAEAKWEQEVVKAREVTAAQQRKEIAILDRDAAELTKQKDILLGQGEAEKKRLVMAADGALEKKLEAYIESQKVWADAVKGYSGNWVPQVVTGGAGANGAANGATTLMELFATKAAKDLALDMKAR
jgi:hypothetical protein